ncbi:Cysteine-rich receptor-like protein kinase 2 [Acorus gramineus]|uniref:Cysteine-rich receptor-like protein kinase 2 n=1 Tax=Acorus gramineus TaxID=55184 RepID=A0AAV9B0I5_ACOGR|nr:Cysteine-rich receptor-like protein kinase 2 [Acorus gramineus]
MKRRICSAPNMYIIKNFTIFLASLVILQFWGTSSADPRTSIAGQICSNATAVSGTILGANIPLAMSNLSSQVYQNGFGETVMGDGPNAFYVLAQCMEDLSPIDCKLCFSEIRNRLTLCFPRTGGRLFLDGCFGRYDNYSFFGEALDSKNESVCLSSKKSDEPEKFSKVMRMAVGNVSLEARKKQKFAVGSFSDSNFTVYALALCWESLDDANCSSCLDAAVSSIVSCAPAIEGRSLNAGCYMRYSTSLFWNLNQTGSSSSVIGIVVWKKRKEIFIRSDQYMGDRYGPGLSAAISQSNLNFMYGDLKRATRNFDLSNKLGQGSYGTVYKGVLSDGREVAVKRLFLNTTEWADQFFNEVNLINRVRHKNLVKLLGCSIDGPESCLVFEYCYNKSLDSFIFDSNRNLDWKSRFDIIQGVAEGLSYLHEESDIRIIHRDIKASNILLDDKLKPKITDFGLARSFGEDQTHLSTGVAGTVGYMAPEYIIHGQLTEKADVYSFGILVLEIVTGKRCTGVGIQAGQYFLLKIWNNYKSNTVESIIDDRIYVASLKDEMLHVVHVGLLCTQATPNNRPTMARVVEMLRSNRAEEDPIPTDPPFLEVLSMEGVAEVSHLLSTGSVPSLSESLSVR